MKPDLYKFGGDCKKAGFETISFGRTVFAPTHTNIK